MEINVRTLIYCYLVTTIFEYGYEIGDVCLYAPNGYTITIGFQEIKIYDMGVHGLTFFMIYD